MCDEFKQKYTLFARQRESGRLVKKFPDRIPVVIHPGPRAPPIDKNKYLVPGDLTFSEFMHIVRKRIKVKQFEALLGFVKGGTLPPSSMALREIYKESSDEDGFLYVTYSLENTFG
jgi:GABA(A) receptor-associated protein